MAQYKIEDVEGIGPAYGEKLRTAGVTNTDQLLTAGKTKKGRAELAQKTGISETLILKWVNMVDLYRIKGVGSEFSESRSGRCGYGQGIEAPHPGKPGQKNGRGQRTKKTDSPSAHRRDADRLDRTGQDAAGRGRILIAASARKIRYSI